MSTEPGLASTREAAQQLLAELPEYPWVGDPAPYWYARLRQMVRLFLDATAPKAGDAS